MLFAAVVDEIAETRQCSAAASRTQDHTLCHGMSDDAPIVIYIRQLCSQDSPRNFSVVGIHYSI